MGRDVFIRFTEKIKKNKLIFCCLLFIGTGIIISIISLIRGGSLWFDEIFSVEIAKKSIIDSWQYLKYENNPPLYYWLLHFYIRIFGTNELILRLSSFLPALLSIFLFYTFAKSLFGKRTALIATAVFSLSPLFIRHSSETRMYAHLFLWIIIASHSFWRLINGDNRRRNYILFFCSNVIVLFLHITGVLFIASQFVFIIINRKTIKNTIPIILILAIAVILFMPWVLLFLNNKLLLIETGELFSGWYFKGNGSVPVTVEAPIFLFSEFSNYWPNSYLPNLLIFIAGSILIFLVFIRGNILKNRALSMCLVFFLLPITIFPLIINNAIGRYYILSAIFYYLIIGRGLFLSLSSIKNNLNIFKKRSSIVLGILFISFIVFQSVESRYFNVIETKGNWPETVRIAQELKLETLIGSIEMWPAEVYQKKSKLNIIYFYPRTVTPGNNNLLNVTRYNWVMFEDNDREEDNLKNQFAEKISPEIKKIGFINRYLIPSGMMQSILAENGFVLRETHSFNSGEPSSMSIFIRE